MYNHNWSALYNRDGKRKYLNRDERLRFYKQLQRANIDIRLFGLVLFWTGARISEVLALTPSSFDHTEQVVSINSLKKRSKSIYRKIPVPDELIKEIRQHVRSLEDTAHIWPWSRRTASRYISKLMRRADIDGPMACSKGLRHSYAVHCIMNGIPLHVIQKWLGHASISTSAIYANVIGPEERALAEKLW